MITDIDAYLRFFDSLRRRTERDVAALPPAAAAWRPPAVGGEVGWSIGRIVWHIGGSRLYFASAYRGEGWIWEKTEADPDDQAGWLPWLKTSGERFVALLMMMLEHEVYHRSQIDSYAGLEGWPVPDIFGRSAESIDALQESQRLKYG